METEHCSERTSVSSQFEYYLPLPEVQERKALTTQRTTSISFVVKARAIQFRELRCTSGRYETNL